jgi:hypothetical protein
VVDPGSRLALAVLRFVSGRRRHELDQSVRHVSDLDRVHARIMLEELLRGTAPPIETWPSGLLADAVNLSLELSGYTTAELARRRAEGLEGGELEQG